MENVMTSGIIVLESNTGEQKKSFSLKIILYFECVQVCGGFFEVWVILFFFFFMSGVYSNSLTTIFGLDFAFI